MKSLVVRHLTRSGIGIADDHLAFEKGVNVVVGRPNTGKTKWLQMLDYAFGSDSQPKEVFGEDLAEKFSRIEATVEIDGEPLVIERRWNEVGIRTKVFVDGEAVDEREFSTELLKLLDIPILHYPQGNPHGPRTWPQLSWRSLLRHIYRRQHFWADLADSQPTSEQHAALLQFVGMAEHLFSQDYASLVAKEKQVWELQTARQQFLEMLHEISRELLDEEDRNIALTGDSLVSAIQRVRKEIAEAEDARKMVLSDLVNSAAQKTREKPSIFQELGERLAQLRGKESSVRQARAELERRAREIEEYHTTLGDELARLNRAKVAGDTLANLKVTHCPACDQPIKAREQQGDECYVCKRLKPGSSDGVKRLTFELEHLQAEQQEAIDLLGKMQDEIAGHRTIQKDLAAQIRRLETQIRPTQAAAAAILPPEIAVLDTRVGQLQERLEQLERVRATFSKREALTQRIAQIEQSIVSLQESVRQKMKVADLQRASDWLSDGMNEYLNGIDSRQQGAWPHAPVAVHLWDRNFEILVGRVRWTATLGGTLTLYFLIAYHYGLLTLFPRTGCHYPGLVILDFPPVLEDGSSVRDKENFVVEPFVGLMARPEFANTQLIAVGSSFEGLEGANRIELGRVWAAGAIRGAA
jgi:hypothetical protein